VADDNSLGVGNDGTVAEARLDDARIPGVSKDKDTEATHATSVPWTLLWFDNDDVRHGQSSDAVSAPMANCA
jgi:hypothetical protein